MFCRLYRQGLQLHYIQHLQGFLALQVRQTSFRPMTAPKSFLFFRQGFEYSLGHDVFYAYQA